MYKGKWIFNSVAMAIVTGVVFVNADRAQSIPNLSDITGTNNFTSPPTSSSFSSESGSSPAVIQQNVTKAGSISQELTDASSGEPEASAKEPPKGPRHFARKPTENCPNPSVAKAERLKETVNNANNFLNEVDKTSSNDGSDRAW